MEFDERLRSTFESLAARLQQQIAGHLDAVSAEVSASAQADREAAVADATREARTATERELTGRLADDVVQAETQARAELTATQRAASERLIEAVRAIDG